MVFVHRLFIGSWQSVPHRLMVFCFGGKASNPPLGQPSAPHTLKRVGGFTWCFHKPLTSLLPLLPQRLLSLGIVVLQESYPDLATNRLSLELKQTLLRVETGSTSSRSRLCFELNHILFRAELPVVLSGEGFPFHRFRITVWHNPLCHVVADGLAYLFALCKRAPMP